MNPWNLTAREAEVMARMVACGGVQKIVASDLGLSVKTVDTYVGRATEKIGSRTRTAALLEWDRKTRPSSQRSVEPCMHCAGLGFVQRSAA
jgi:DNA-binding NarL/FixJ family response regulator